MSSVAIPGKSLSRLSNAARVGLNQDLTSINSSGDFESISRPTKLNVAGPPPIGEMSRHKASNS